MIYDRHFLFSDSRFIEQADHRFKPVVVFTFIAFGAAIAKWRQYSAFCPCLDRKDILFLFFFCLLQTSVQIFKNVSARLYSRIPVFRIVRWNSQVSLCCAQYLFVFVQQITAGGTVETVECYQAPDVGEQVYRADLEFVKVSDGDLERLANIPFSITSKTTGESHVIVTDENGYASTSSAWNPHTSNTLRYNADRNK